MLKNEKTPFYFQIFRTLPAMPSVQSKRNIFFLLQLFVASRFLFTHKSQLRFFDCEHKNNFTIEFKAKFTIKRHIQHSKQSWKVAALHSSSKSDQN
jgi:hypothetical protein